jgi:hypothetical protein
MQPARPFYISDPFIPKEKSFLNLKILYVAGKILLYLRAFYTTGQVCVKSPGLLYTTGNLSRYLIVFIYFILIFVPRFRIS